MKKKTLVIENPNLDSNKETFQHLLQIYKIRGLPCIRFLYFNNSQFIDSEEMSYIKKRIRLRSPRFTFFIILDQLITNFNIYGPLKKSIFVYAPRFVIDTRLKGKRYG